MSIHEKYMRIAIDLAKRSEGLTSPNPIVGAVIVKNGKIVGEGYHKRLGLAHAEVNALRHAGASAKDATLYVTLEPCDHFGRTPPCTDAIIKSGIKKVVIGMIDPNPINNERGIRKLNRHGIKVNVGILEEETKSINRPYIKFITKKMPYVTIKVAQSLDGKIATRLGESRWITSDDSRRYVHELRSRVDAVMVGANTVIKDDPLLMSRPIRNRQPIRVVVDSKLIIPLSAKIFLKTHQSPVMIATIKKSPKAKLYERRGARVIIVKGKDGKVDLKELLKNLAKLDIAHILVEGGGELIASLLEERLADKLLFFIAPKIIGGRLAVTSVEGEGVGRLKDAHVLEDIKIKRFSRDFLIEAEVR